TKIVATIGPSTEEYPNLRKVIEAGVDICRLNFSHGTHDDHQKRLDNIRRLEKEFDKKIPIIGDTQGPKMRIGSFEGAQQVLKDGQTFTVDNDPTPGDSARVQLPNIAVLHALEVGHYVLVDDGKIKLRVTEKGKDYAKTKVIVGGVIKDKKGFNLPNTIVDLPILTEKDLRDLEFMLGPTMGVDLVAVSFAQTPDDLRKAKKIIAGRAPMVVKVEKPTAAIDYLDEIVDLADVVMIARGDMAVEVGPEKVPSIQKHIIRVCRDRRRPAIVATQMLESMIEGTFPTRAEATDVANAVYEGTDCTMLSAESASGRYPTEAVRMMDTIIRQTEADPDYREYLEGFSAEIHSNTIGNIMATSVVDIADAVGAKAVFAYTTSGTTAIDVSKNKPDAPTIAITTDSRIAGRVGMAWGVIPVVISATDSHKIDDLSRDIAIKRGLAKKGDLIVVTFSKGTATAKKILSASESMFVGVVKV
ncbi:MAG: pyruvate kinase, partial [Rickettsiales bacterium]|nr:pyruvate kinase [Rickettsiales bacterium]